MLPEPYRTNTVVTLIVVMHISPQPCHSVSLVIYKIIAVTYDQSFHTDLSTPVELLLPARAPLLCSTLSAQTFGVCL